MRQWRKSSYSGVSDNTDCVELANMETGVGLRDSKAPEAGHLTLAPDSFAVLLDGIKTGKLDLEPL